MKKLVKALVLSTVVAAVGCAAENDGSKTANTSAGPQSSDGDPQGGAAPVAPAAQGTAVANQPVGTIATNTTATVVASTAVALATMTCPLPAGLSVGLLSFDATTMLYKVQVPSGTCIIGEENTSATLVYVYSDDIKTDKKTALALGNAGY